MDKERVQLHVNVPVELWRALKQEALDKRDTLAGVVEKALVRLFGDKVKPTLERYGEK